MTESVDLLANTQPSWRAGVTINGALLTPEQEGVLMRVVVDNDVKLPGMFELTFLDLEGTLASELGVAIGSEVIVTGATPMGAELPLIVGEVTAIEGQIYGIDRRTIIRGYTAAHRLQRVRRSRTFINSTDADVATQVATEAGLQVGTIGETPTAHAYLAQVNQTDWEFLSARAQEIGFEMGVTIDGLFYFQPFGDADSAGGATAGVSISYPQDLISFRPRVTAGNLTPDVEVRVWDPMNRIALAQAAPTPSSGGTTSPDALGAQFAGAAGGGGGLGAAAGQMVDAGLAGYGVYKSAKAIAHGKDTTDSGVFGALLGSPVGDLGPPPSPTAHVMVDKPFADAITMATSGPQVADALSTDHGSTFAEAEGEARGDAAIQPGATVDIQGVQDLFVGSWTVSRARHIFDDSEFGYRVIFSAHGRQDRTMLGLIGKTKQSSSAGGVLDGVVCGVVTNCLDPLGRGRVKFSLPWLSPDFESDWAPIAQFNSGAKSGAIFMPSIGDEVLAAFEFGDARRPYVIGSMMNNLTQWNVAAKGPIWAGGVAQLLQPLRSGAGGMGAQMTADKYTMGMVDTSSLGVKDDNPLEQLLGASGELVGAAGEEKAGAKISSIAGVVGSPGMLTETHHRGYLSSTGNALLFYDIPPPIPIKEGLQAATGAVGGAATAAEYAGTGTKMAGKAGGIDKAKKFGKKLSKTAGKVGGAAGTVGSFLDNLHPATGALGSSVRLGSQDGSFGITADQVNGGVSISASMIPGVTMSTPSIFLTTAPAGLVYISSSGTPGSGALAGAAIGANAGPKGAAVGAAAGQAVAENLGITYIDGGTAVITRSGISITHQAPIITLIARKLDATGVATGTAAMPGLINLIGNVNILGTLLVNGKPIQ